MRGGTVEVKNFDSDKGDAVNYITPTFVYSFDSSKLIDNLLTILSKLLLNLIKGLHCNSLLEGN